MKRIGIVGCGSIANTHAWAIGRQNDAKLVAFADIKPERASMFSQKYTDNKALVFDNLSQMLKDADLDVLHICTPHYLHVPMAIEALKAGVSVFCEKPPAINMEQFEQLHEVVSVTKAKLGFCFQNRYNKTVEVADETVKSGKLGKILGARAFVTWRRDEGYYETDWKGKLSTEGGGALMNQSVHTLDLILRYMGEPVEVKASLTNHHLPSDIEVEDTVEAWMRFNDGERACFYASTGYATDAPVVLELTCEKGTVGIGDGYVIVRKEGCVPECIAVEEAVGMGKSYWGTGHAACINDFYRSLDSEERFQNDLEGVRNTMKTMMKIYDFR